MKKIVIFGATGNIGVYLVDYCIHHLDLTQYEIIAVGRKNTNFFQKLGVEYVQVDIRDADMFTRLPQKDIYAIVNLAGLLPAYVKDYNPFAYIDSNITGALNILEYARKTGADRVLYAQTWAELAGYWGNETVLHPDMPRKLIYTGDHAFYSITKSMIVDTLEYYHQEYHIKNFVFRLPNIYLYHPQKTYFVDGIQHPIAYRYMIDRAAAGLDLEMWGNPDAFKDIIYVKDLCQMMCKALLALSDGGIYHAGTGKKTTMREQIEGIIEVFSPGKRSKIIAHPEKSSFTSFVMDIENARNELDYQPVYDYKAYLNDYKMEMRENRFADIWSC